jgi:hypothetical protein
MSSSKSLRCLFGYAGAVGNENVHNGLFGLAVVQQNFDGVGVFAPDGAHHGVMGGGSAGVGGTMSRVRRRRSPATTSTVCGGLDQNPPSRTRTPSAARSRERGHQAPSTYPVVSAFGRNRNRSGYRGCSLAVTAGGAVEW